MSLVLVACRTGQGGSNIASGSPSSSAGAELHGTVTAGPVCPVERNPPNPSCAPRAVAGATIVVQDSSGNEVARAVSDPAGQFTVALGPGRYTLVPQATNGLFAAPRVDVEISPGVQPAAVAIVYDTGIR